MSLARTFLAGVGSGALASLVMGVGLVAAEHLGLLGPKMPPRTITRRTLESVGFRPSPTTNDLATFGAHMGYGAAAGVVYAGLRRAVGGRRWGTVGGAAFGAAVWAVSYAGWLPGAHVFPPPQRDWPTRPGTMLGLHLLYGAALGRALARADAPDDFHRQVVVISGGSRGLGLEVARCLGDEGARLVLLARDGQELDRAVEELRGRGVEVRGLVCDVTRATDITSAIREVLDTAGRIDMLVNNAGVIEVGPEPDMAVTDFETAMATHFWGPLHMIRAVLPEMRARRAGRIVNIASIGGKIAFPHLLPYTASKHALVGLSDGLHAELAEEGISVTTVCPSLLRTGSYTHASFKGRHGREYAWFSLASSLPGMAMSSSAAARAIVEAARGRRAELLIGAEGRLGVITKAVAPGLFARVMSTVARFLPAPGWPGARIAREGRHIAAPLPLRAATILGTWAGRRNNEMVS